MMIFHCLFARPGSEAAFRASLGLTKDPAASNQTPIRFLDLGRIIGRCSRPAFVPLARNSPGIRQEPPYLENTPVTSAIQSLIAFVSAYPAWAYTTIFLAALLEAVPVVGSFIPGSTVILGLSAVVATGGLQLPEVLGCAISGALIGDAAAYGAGYHAQRRILNLWPLSAYPNVVARSEKFFKRYGLLAVFFARFVPPVRAFVPITAGALNMPPRRFFPVNVIAILLWAPLHVLPGLVAGSALKEYGAGDHHIGTYAAIAAAGAVVIWAIWQRWRRAQTS